MQQQPQQQQQGQQPGMAPRMPMCTEGKVLKGKWRIVRQIGMGAFGEIYIGRNVTTNEKVAIKVEIVDEKKQALRAEVVIMRKLQGCPCVAQFISCGRQDNINFLVMQLLGENLSDLRKRQPGGMFSLPTVCRLGVEMIQALQSIHVLGILHRDVKPSNFVLDKSINSPDYTTKKDGRVYLYVIDFGLSRKFVGADGEIKPPRPNAGFRGTARYASIYSHAAKELSPRDDLWSVFYLLVEFAVGTLPWTKIRDRDKVGEVKNQYMNGTKLVDKLPSEFAEFQKYLMSLDYYSIPNYAYLSKMFRALHEKTTGSATFAPYDWEKSLIPIASAQQQQASAESGASVLQSPKSKDKKQRDLEDDGIGGKSSEVQWQMKCHTAKSQDAPVGSVYNPDVSDAKADNTGSYDGGDEDKKQKRKDSVMGSNGESNIDAGNEGGSQKKNKDSHCCVIL